MSSFELSALEKLRDFANTWHVPNDTRIPVDELQSLLAGELVSIEISNYLKFDGVPKSVIALRDDLRAAIEKPTKVADYLNTWLDKTALRFLIVPVADTTKPQIVPNNAEFIEIIMSMVVDSISTGEFRKLKCCPDCKWCFIDNSKNQTKRWCSMGKGSQSGRACGTIAKVGNFRSRQRNAIGAP